MKFITKQSTTSFPLYLTWFAAQSSCIPPESHCSLRGFSAQSKCGLRQFDGKCFANPRRLQYNSTETALQIEKILNRLKKFCWLATPLQMRWDSCCLGLAPRGGDIPGPCSLNECLCPLKRKWCPFPSEDCAPKKLTRSGLMECKSRPKTPKLVFIALEFASKNCICRSFLWTHTGVS